MKSSSRLLLASGVTIGVLVIAAIVLVFTLAGKGGGLLLPEDTPEGTVQRYFLALEAEDYQKAYSYLSPSAIAEQKYYNSYEKWSQAFSQRRQTDAWKATLEKSTVTGNEATVDVIVDVFTPSGPFDDPVHSRRYTFRLKKEGTFWSITAPVYPLYLY